MGIGVLELLILTIFAMAGWLSLQFPFLRPAAVLLGAIFFIILGLRFQASTEIENALHPGLPQPSITTQQ